MKANADLNKDRPDAKLFMDIALTHPKNVPSCKDYYFLSSKHVPELNKAFNLEGNKKIKSHYDGFKFSENSPTAQRLNASPEFKSEIFAPKNYDSEKGQFKSDKLEIELKNDKNLGYSFGHMTVLNPKITDDGYVVGWEYDMYNYEWKNLEDYKNNGFAGMTLNNSAKTLQAADDLKNYFVLVPIKVKI